MKLKYYQQGDVLLKQIKKLPKTKSKPLKTNVVEEGEATGHAHRVVGDHELYAIGQTIYLQANAEVELRHEEHKTIKLPKGIYQIEGVREFDHFRRETRRVVD